MDISLYISELLYEHDCVIIPGFGGFICSYKPAVIHVTEAVISPPSKAISFNKNLVSNDGLLISYISNRANLSFDAANEMVGTWVESAKSLLRGNETLKVKNIGSFFNDIEGNLQFTPDESVNYLKSSFGLKSIPAHPILRDEKVDIPNEIRKEHVLPRRPVRIWRIAAALLLIGGLAAILQMMRMGVEIKPLNLDQATVFGFINRVFNHEEHEIAPLPAETPVKTVPDVEKNASPVQENRDSSVSVPVAPIDIKSTAVEESRSPQYFIVTGAFAKEKNAEGAKTILLQRYPDTKILVEKKGGLTRIGYSAGGDYKSAKEELRAVQEDHPDYWLLKN